jgi:hypothetical protein
MTEALVPYKAEQGGGLVTMGFGTKAGFELMQRAAQLLSSSALVPKEYQNNVANATIALEMAARIGASPLMVMQNLYLVHGKPSWSSQFIIAAVNGTGRFSPLRFQIDGEGDKKQCIAWATEKPTGERLESPPVSIEMAKKEGWYGKPGSKWPTMPDLMLRYRAATLFGRLYAPEVLMGMRSYEDVVDVEGEVIDTTVEEKTKSKAVALKEKLKSATGKHKATEQPAETSTDHTIPERFPCAADTARYTTKAICDDCPDREGCEAWGQP